MNSDLVFTKPSEMLRMYNFKLPSVLNQCSFFKSLTHESMDYYLCWTFCCFLYCFLSRYCQSLSINCLRNLARRWLFNHYVVLLQIVKIPKIYSFICYAYPSILCIVTFLRGCRSTLRVRLWHSYRSSCALLLCCNLGRHKFKTSQTQTRPAPIWEESEETRKYVECVFSCLFVLCGMLTEHMCVFYCVSVEYQRNTSHAFYFPLIYINILHGQTSDCVCLYVGAGVLLLFKVSNGVQHCSCCLNANAVAKQEDVGEEGKRPEPAHTHIHRHNLNLPFHTSPGGELETRLNLLVFYWLSAGWSKPDLHQY